MRYGLIGEHLSHSFSKEVHALLADYEYEICEIARGDLDAFMTAKNFTAINVTIPYKTDVIPYLYHISDEAKKIGAVNTIVNRDGKLYGYNTDFFGMASLIDKLGLSLKGKKVAILGTGGTAKTAKAVAESINAAEILTVSRRKRDGVIDYSELIRCHSDVQIIINTTPVGMYPDNSSKPIELSVFRGLEGVVDAIYNPIRTELVLDALELGIKAEGGLYMLVAQAVYASEIFLDVKYPKEQLENIYNKILRDKENIVLIGMPACGKSTVGRIIKDETLRSFTDTDDLIVEYAKTSIKEIFANEGEDAFRDLESAVIANISSQNSMIISTGGGVVLRDSNVRRLKQNGRLFFIDRPLHSLLPTSDRPLASTAKDIEGLYEKRHPIYVGAADETIEASADAQSVANKIIEVFNK